MKFKIPFIAHLSTHVDTCHLHDCTSSCPFCLNPAPRASIAVIQTSPEITLLQCDHCHAVSASHMPTSSFLEGYYQQHFAKIYERYDSHKKITFDGADRFAGHICRYIDAAWAARQEGLHIIDFGGGDGGLAAELAVRLKQKARITVVDYGPEWIRSGPVSTEKKNFVESIHNSAHIVIASASLEHLPQPRPVIHKLYSLLEPGGYFYARTPFVTPFMRLLSVYDFGYPAHLHDLGPAFWNSFVRLFANDAVCVASQPSIVETCFTKKPIKTIIAAACKLPAHLEMRWNRCAKQPFWQFVGGWEAIFRKQFV